MSFPIRFRTQSKPTQDGDGVNIRRVDDFQGKVLDPYLMIDELRSDDEKDYMGGFPPHPHRGMETFTYIRKGGFEHKDHMGNKEAIRAGGVQWMSTGSGVLHSEMPLADAKDGMHGFQIWVNMPAKNKMRAPIYQDSNETGNPEISNGQGAVLRTLAGEWTLAEQSASAPITELSADAKIADLMLEPGATATISGIDREFIAVLIYDGALSHDNISRGDLVVVDSKHGFTVTASEHGAGMLILTGNPLKEPVAHWGPFVMNTKAELQQAFDDYQAGKFGQIN